MDRQIILEWNVHSFIPGFNQNSECGIVREYIDPDLFTTDQKVKEYWSLPERLLDISLIRNQMASQGIPEKQQDLETYLRAEYGLYRIVTTIGKWASIFSPDKFKSDPEVEENANKFWKENRAFFEKCAQVLNEGASFLTDNQLEELYGHSLDISAYIVSDARRKDLTDSAKAFKQKAKKIKKKHQIYSSASLSNQERASLMSLAREFINKCQDYFNNRLWRKESRLLEEQKILMSRIARILPPKRMEKIEADFVQKNENPEALNDLLMNGLQESAHIICQMIQVPASDNGNELITALNGEIDKVCEMMRIHVKGAEQLEAYKKDGSRCVALLELWHSQNKQDTFLAFSGFWDCNDRDAITKTNTQRNSVSEKIVEQFQNIANQLGVTLAVLSSNAVDIIYRYLPATDCTLKRYGPFRNELDTESNPERLKALKGQYSCCERKILAEIQNHSYTGITAASLWVKFSPCQNCFGALQQWVNDEKVPLTLDYPDMPANL